MRERRNDSERLLSPAFLLVTAGSTFYFLSFGVVTLVLPHYVAGSMHDGKFAVGTVVGCFAVSAVLTRPIAGRLGNRSGRRWLMIVGAIAAGVSFATYSLTTNLALLIMLRLVTGVGEGLFYTGSATIVADLAPPGRVGEAISLYSASIWIGTGLGPVVGQSVYHLAGPRAGFEVAAALTMIAVPLCFKVPNVRSTRTRSAIRQPLIARRALAPGGVVALGVTGTVAFYAYLPLYAETIRLGSVQYVYLLYAAVVLGMRVVFARIFDAWGSYKTGMIATTAMGMGFVVIAAIASPIGLYAGTVILAFGNSLIFPALLAMALDRAHPEERAPIVSTFTASLDVATGLGGLSLGALAAVSGYRGSFAGGAVFDGLALVLLRSRSIRRSAERPAMERNPEFNTTPISGRETTCE